jgi:putative protein-disulfide isomerase
MEQISALYKQQFSIEVLSGGMIPADAPKPISVTAPYLVTQYRQVESMTGVQFGSDYLWHIKNPQDSDWFPASLKPACALCIFKEEYPHLQVTFAAELQTALFKEGRDLCDDEAYRHLLDKYHIDALTFYRKLNSSVCKEQAAYEFALVKQLQVTAFPVLLLQETDTKFHLLAKGYTDFETLNARLIELSR